MLKPQLEGGGGNYYGIDVAFKMKSFKKDELAAHILMERIRPMVVQASAIVRYDPVQNVHTMKLGTMSPI